MQEPRDEPREMQQRFKNVFGTIEGRIVLGEILTLGHFGETLNSSIDMAENNFAVTIARMAGAFDPLWIHLGMTEKEK